MTRRTRDRYATALDGIAATTAALTFDTRQLEYVLDDADTRYLARSWLTWSPSV